MQVKHTKKETEARQQNEIQFRRGEISREQCDRPIIIPRPNPAKTKVRVPVRLHDSIIKSREPVVGLDYLTEFLPVSDPELDPQYQCELCGNKGMLSHILGRKHRQAFVVEINKDDPRRVLDLSQSLQDRWDPVRKSLFRFIQNIPTGSTLSIVTQVIIEIIDFINDYWMINLCLLSADYDIDGCRMYQRG